MFVLTFYVSFLLFTFCIACVMGTVYTVSLLCSYLVSSMLSESQWISDTSPGDQSQGHATAVHNVMTAVLTGGRPRFLQASASWNPQTSAAEDSEQLCRAICLVATRIAEISWYIVFVVCCLVSCCVLLCLVVSCCFLFLVPGSWFKKNYIPFH